MATRPDLQGHVAVVTGAGRGLGRELAVAFAKAGAAVALAGRRASDLESAAAEITAACTADTIVVPTDVSVPEQVDELRARTSAVLGDASILVNAAGVFGPFELITDSDPDAWISTLMIDTVGPYLTCRAFAGPMISAGWGRIVNVSSAGALQPPTAFNSAYATAKGALNRLTRHLSIELEGTGVTANVIHPGSLKTEMWAYIRDKAAMTDERGAPFREWARSVESTGGDPPGKAVQLVLRLIDPSANPVSGKFCWPENGLDQPIESW